MFACGGGARTAGEPATPGPVEGGDVHVELLVYSGRENPAWDLTDAEVDELARRLAAAPVGPPPPEAPGLGYGGFRVTNPSGGRGLPSALTVYQGVALETPSGPQYRRDDAAIEDWLLGSARTHGYGALLAELGR
jgi:hypothetical protein